MPTIRVRTHHERVGTMLVSVAPTVRRQSKDMPDKPLWWRSAFDAGEVAHRLGKEHPLYRFDVEEDS